MKIELSFDDGDELDLKVIDLLEKYDLKGVFYIPIESWGFKHFWRYRFHEIGCHTQSHPQDLKLLTDKELIKEIDSAKILFETILVLEDSGIKKFCFPRGRYDDRVIEAVKKAGFTEARTTKVLHTKDTDPFLKHTAVHMYPRKEYNGRDWLDVAFEMLDDPTSEVLRFWGHAEEIDRYQEWDKFEELLERTNEIKHS